MINVLGFFLLYFNHTTVIAWKVCFRKYTLNTINISKNVIEVALGASQKVRSLKMFYSPLFVSFLFVEADVPLPMLYFVCSYLQLVFFAPPPTHPHKPRSP